MNQVPGRGITQLLNACRGGDVRAYDQLFELVYPELRRIAGRLSQRERPGHTIQSTALVHEAYLRIAGHSEKDWQNRAHFFAVAARVMRGILVDYARARQTAKRSAATLAVGAPEGSARTAREEVNLIDLDDALQALETRDPQQCRIVEMRYFAGMSTEETASVLRISVSTVKRDWLMAKTWLRRQLAAQGTGRTRGWQAGWAATAGSA